MRFAVEQTPTAEGICVAVAGEVDIHTGPRMRQALHNAVATGRPVVVDLGAVTFMDTGGLSALVATHTAAEAAGQTFRLQHVPARVRTLLGITGLDALLVTVPTSQDDLPA